MGTFMFSMMPNGDGKIECIAQESGQEIKFMVAETDLNRMLHSLYLWKAKKLEQGDDDN